MRYKFYIFTNTDIRWNISYNTSMDNRYLEEMQFRFTVPWITVDAILALRREHGYEYREEILNSPETLMALCKKWDLDPKRVTTFDEFLKTYDINYYSERSKNYHNGFECLMLAIRDGNVKAVKENIYDGFLEKDGVTVDEPSFLVEDLEYSMSKWILRCPEILPILHKHMSQYCIESLDVSLCFHVGKNTDRDTLISLMDRSRM